MTVGKDKPEGQTLTGKAASPSRPRRFSSLLMSTIIALVTLSVIIILLFLNVYFSRRVDGEFQKKLRAQKGQIELLIHNRMTAIRDTLQDISSDNAVRVTVMLGAKSQLAQRVLSSYPPRNGAFYFVQSIGERSLSPEDYPGLSEGLIQASMRMYPRGDLFEDGAAARMLWLFAAPIVHAEGMMGTAYAIYDMMADAELFNTIRRTTEGDVVFFQGDLINSLLSGRSLPTKVRQIQEIPESTEIVRLGADYALSKFSDIDSLYFCSSLRGLNQEQRKVTVLMGLFSAVVLIASTLAAVFIGRRMVQPLREMTRKAIRISEGQKELKFDRSGVYWEFDQLSEAFNYMLANLKSAEERSRYKELLENVDDAVYILDESGQILDANAAAYSQLEYPPETFFGLKVTAILPESDARRIMAQLGNDSAAATAAKLSLETFHRKKDGSRLPVEILSRPIVYRGNSVILNVARDISRRVEMEKALRESEERYRSVVENSNDGIMVLDRRLTIHFANGVMSEILGHTDTPLESGNLDDYLADGSEPFTFEQLAAPPLSGGLREPLVREVVRKTGELRTVRMSGNRFRDSGGEEKIVVQALDITDRLRIEEEKQQLEAQLIHAQKMEAIGTLAGGIAHDFNNLLMGIQGRLSMIRLQSKPDQAHYRHIDPIEKTIYSAAGLTRQLLGFARKGPYEIKPVCLNTLVEESTRMFISTRKEIRLVLRCVPEVWTVRADRGQIEQVMVNLYVNAWQAMPDGGELTIETSNVTLGEDAGRSLGTKPGNYVRITVADTGVGMEPEIMERIFEPFFTTKGMGIGTGLGLASAYGIVKNHKGVITVDSQKGKGTTFTVYLPADTSTAVSTPGRSTAAETPKKGRGRILVVDDEQEFIATAELMLAELGYEVISARSGEEALETYRENRDRLDLVTLDMIMPGMSGKETLEQLKRFDPNVRVLLISGYSRNLQDDELIRRSGGGLLQKPFDLYTLSRKLEELLRG